jgi:Zn-dependent M28 family amino/carboxypeptidase
MGRREYSGLEPYRQVPDFSTNPIPPILAMTPFQHRRSSVLPIALGLVLTAPVAIAFQATQTPAPTIAEALANASKEIRVYNDHVVTLASPFMEGRVPGSRGMGIAREYIEHYLKEAGLKPAYDLADEGAETTTSRASWRQPFPLSDTLELISQSMNVVDGVTFEAEVDFTAMNYGITGEATGELVFVGYSVRKGKDDYQTYSGDEDLTGKIALMLRFEPMDESGKSLWRDGKSGWTARGGFATKLSAVKRYNPAAVIIVNTPGADDPRVDQLIPLRGGRSRLEVPVFHMSGDAADQLVKAVDSQGRSLLDLRRMADEAGGIENLGGSVHVQAELDKKPLMAENVGGVLPGRGALADQYIVVGAHLDHLGMGYFGSRSGSSGTLHPGADDNASGSAGVIMLADRLKQAYDAMATDTDARTILFTCFSAEESGLNGSRFFVKNPPVPLEQISLMINFDMIGRIVNKRLSVSGTKSAEGMAEWLQPILDRSPLEVITNREMRGGSDHLSFIQSKIPYLFGIIADFHDDYHTPRDVSSLINRVDAVHTIDLFEEILVAAATRSESFEFKEAVRGGGTASAVRSRVRVGVRVGTTPDGAKGVLVESVVDDSAAAKAGIEDGDLLVKWGDKEIESYLAWRKMLGEHKPGDVVSVVVKRKGKEKALKVTL